MIFTQSLIFMGILAFLNRAAGSNLYHLKDKWNLSGKAVLWVLPFVFAATCYWYEWQIALIWTMTFWVWRIPAWGRWIDLGTMPDDFNREDEEPSWYEAIINRLSFGYDAVALFWRHFLTLIPGFVALYMVSASLYVWAMPVFAFLLMSAYAWAKGILYPKHEYIWLAELVSGVLWGGMILMSI